MFEWKPQYSVQIASIDDQHKKLFAIAEELNTAMAHGQAKVALGKILDRLVQYTVFHFNYEERLMTLHGYSDLAPHKLEHETLKKQVVDFQHEFEGGNAFVSVELMAFLQDWLQKHIQGTDMLYSPFLIQRNVA
jgi:hemerythrin